MLILGYAPGLGPLPENLQDLSVVIAAGFLVMVFAILRANSATYGPIVLWRHRPAWWPATVIAITFAVAATAATRSIYPALGHQRSSAAFVIAFACLAAPIAAATYSVGHDTAR